MSRPQANPHRCSRRPASPSPIGLGWLLLSCALSGAMALLVASVSLAGASVAVAPFENEDTTWTMARAISDRLSEATVDRLLPPGSFVAEPVFEPAPQAVRRWAYQAAVENVVVGRVLPSQEPGRGEKRSPSRRVEVALHSGHSGAEMARHEILVEGPLLIEAAAETLAVAILRDLGEEPARATPSAEPPPAASAPGVTTGESSASSGRGLDATFDFGGFSSDAPMEIKAEEAEIVNRNDGRDLIFQRNVFVRQANITLRSDRLEASYDKGESDPRKLVATGRVHVDQGDRRARCDRAVFLRDTQQLTCTGHAELVQGCDVVRGDSIRFDLARDRARVEGAASIVIRPDDTPVDQCLEGGGVL